METRRDRKRHGEQVRGRRLDTEADRQTDRHTDTDTDTDRQTGRQ